MLQSQNTTDICQRKYDPFYQNVIANLMKFSLEHPLFWIGLQINLGLGMLTVE
jgi:hypothetical protein